MSLSHWKPMPRAEHGFTLLEVVFALAIAVLGIAAVAKATGTAATVAGETRERMLAVWVAGNDLSELRIARAWPVPGSRDTVRTMGGRTWYLTRTVSTTQVEDLRRVDITVYTDADRSAREFDMYGYVARYRTPEELGVVPETEQEPESSDEETDASGVGVDDSLEGEARNGDPEGEAGAQ
jgi:general secretion pathway protein I